LCNGTRLFVKELMKNAIDVEIVDVQHAWKRMFIPKIQMSPSLSLSFSPKPPSLSPSATSFLGPSLPPRRHPHRWREGLGAPLFVDLLLV
jgi:hypothetical protein